MSPLENQPESQERLFCEFFAQNATPLFDGQPQGLRSCKSLDSMFLKGQGRKISTFLPGRVTGRGLETVMTSSDTKLLLEL